MSNELDKLNPALRYEMSSHVADMVRMAVAAEGVESMMLPAASVTAAHEAGHCVIAAAQGLQPWCAWVKYCSAGRGYTGATDFHPDAPGIHINPVEEPEAAINRAAFSLAGWAGESLFEPAGLKLGSSLDELAVAGALIRSAAHGLDANPEELWNRVLGATMWVLTQETATVRRIQRILLQEGRVRGPKLHRLLSGIPKRDMPALIGIAVERQP
ncbi:MAG: hypothetical protein HC889_16260 [Synechococcaceae cyanobacterium SM1_2_3]|nr:hypothetical protein [Synechococcaceae cyanobacterium SM1_2_3]